MDTGYAVFIALSIVLVMLIMWSLIWMMHYKQQYKWAEHRCDYYAKQWGKAEDQVSRLMSCNYPDDDEEDDDDDDFIDLHGKLLVNPDA